MRKQLFITIPDSPKKQQREQQHEIQNNRSMQSVSSNNSPSSTKNFKENVVEFEEFKIDQPQEIKNSISPIDVEIITPKEQIDRRNYPCKQPPGPSKASSKTKVFDFPGTRTKSAEDPKKIQVIEKELQQCKKQLLFKDGQISMLERFISHHLQKSPVSTKQNQKLIRKKDERIEQLLQKIKHMANIIDQKNQEFSNLRYENARLRSQIESLQNEIYILSTKLSNRQSIHQFKQYRPSEQRQERQLTTRFSLKADPSKNIDQLQKRLDHLKTNNLQLQISKTRMSKYNKDPLWVSQTSTNKQKRTIDFRPEDADRRRFIKHY